MEAQKAEKLIELKETKQKSMESPHTHFEYLVDGIENQGRDDLHTTLTISLYHKTWDIKR
jgi:hypothetical protein